VVNGNGLTKSHGPKYVFVETAPTATGELAVDDHSRQRSDSGVSSVAETGVDES
jgi:hypothetical protein